MNIDDVPLQCHTSKLLGLVVVGSLILLGCTMPGHVSEQHYTHELSSEYPVGIVYARYEPEVDIGFLIEGKPILGAAAGAGAGALGCLSLALSGMTAGPPGAAVVLLLCLPVGVTIGGVGGAIAASQDSTSDALEKDFVDHATKLDEQSLFATTIMHYMTHGEGHHAVVLEEPLGPASSLDDPDYISQSLASIGSLLEVRLEKIQLDKSGNLYCLDMRAKARKIEVPSGKVLDMLDYEHRVECKSEADWMIDKERGLASAIQFGYRLLTENIVDELYMSYHPNKADSELTRNSRGKVPRFVLAPLHPKPPEMGLGVGRYFNRTAENVQGYGGMQFQTVNSLTPDFTWESFPRSFDDISMEGGEFENLTYEIRIFDAALTDIATAQPMNLVLEKAGLTSPSYQLEEELEPCSLYFWTVRARFKLNKVWRVTEWAGAYDSILGPAYPSFTRRGVLSPFSVTWPSHYLYYPFRTPERDGLTYCWGTDHASPPPRAASNHAITIGTRNETKELVSIKQGTTESATYRDEENEKCVAWDDPDYAEFMKQFSNATTLTGCD